MGKKDVQDMNVDVGRGEGGTECLRPTNVMLNPCVQGEGDPRLIPDGNESSWESTLKRIFSMRN